jgi:hypothetical protein
MQTGNNNMDKKLRQLENQSLPDLSKQDQHWQQMQQLLQPGVPADTTPLSKKGMRKWLPWVLAACIIGILTFTGYKLLSRTQQAGKNIATVPIPLNIKNSTNAGVNMPAPVPIENNTAGSKMNGNKKQVSAPKVTYIGRPVSRDTAIPAPVVTNQPVQSKKETVTLAGFFQQLEKKPQQIVIDPGIDNLVKGTAGSALMIPANTFDAQSRVTILLKEYYTYEDIITNKLSTTSNLDPLVTGGMIHIQAFADGKEIRINPGMSIRWFIPDTSQRMNGMELFTGTVENKQMLHVRYQSRDTMDVSGKLEFINWVPEKQSFSNGYLQTSVKVLDLKDNPYHTRETKKGVIGKFHISNDPKISRKELQQELKDKYGYYKVKLRNWGDDRHRVSLSRKASPISGDDYSVSYEDVGDSAWISSKLAARYKLKATDSITYTTNAVLISQGSYVKKSFANVNLNALSSRFSVDVRTLGWINCDRFYKSNEPKMDYFVNVGDTAANYYSVLVFEKMKSMIMGYPSGNRVVFPNLPKGIKAKVMCVGIRDGKTVAAVAALPAGGNSIDQLKFEDISPASFREQAAMIDK